jgi:hypothetical protein
VIERKVHWFGLDDDAITTIGAACQVIGNWRPASRNRRLTTENDLEVTCAPCRTFIRELLTDEPGEPQAWLATAERAWLGSDAARGNLFAQVRLADMGG